MQPKRAAFVTLRRLALGDFFPTSRRIPPWIKPNKPAVRPFHHSATRFQDRERPQLSHSSIATNESKPHGPKQKVPSEQPAYEMTFTCKPCGMRSSHRISKQGYHHGSVLITCPECKNKHIISDHLGIFTDKPMTIEDLMRDKGQLVKKGTLSEDGDLEFWEDGTTTNRPKSGPEPAGEK